MGTTLTGTTPQDTYDSLIKVTDNGPLSGTAKYLSDGLGNDSVLALSTSRVGIGNSSPAATLDVASRFLASSNDGNAEVVLASTSNRSPLLYFKEGSTQRGLIYSAAGSNNLVFQSGTTEAMRINSSGNVGIGTSSPSYKLDVSGISSSNTGFLISSGQYDNIGQTPYTGMFMTGSSSTDGFGALLLTSRTDLARPIIFGTSNGSISVERVRIDANGLKFNGDTAAANALDDYEEGTWTMGVSFGGGTTGITYSANTGTYTKIGRQVTVNGWVILTSKGSSTGTAKITGLPFTIAFSQANYAGASFRMSDVSFANQFQGYGGIGATTIELEEITEAGVATVLTDADFANNSTIMINFTYFV